MKVWAWEWILKKQEWILETWSEEKKRYRNITYFGLKYDQDLMENRVAHTHQKFRGVVPPPPPSSSPRTSEEGREPSRRRNWWIKCIFWTESREPRAHCSRFFTHNDLAFAAFINRSFMKLKGRGVQSSLHWIMEQLFYQGQLENISWEMLEKISVEPEALFSTTVCFVRLQYGRANVCIIKGI